jgi:hypothetical protein
MSSKDGIMDWRQVGRDPFEESLPPGRWIWAADGVLGFAREMLPGETAAEAVAEFEQAGELCEEWRVYVNGVLESEG